MTSAKYIVKTRATGYGPRRPARYPGEPRPKRRWHTRSKHDTLGEAVDARRSIALAESHVEVAVFLRGERLFGRGCVS